MSSFATAATEIGELRLVESLTADGRDGRLEIFLRGEWGTVCKSNFGFEEADVACRQLGFSYASRLGSVGELG